MATSTERIIVLIETIYRSSGLDKALRANRQLEKQQDETAASADNLSKKQLDLARAEGIRYEREQQLAELGLQTRRASVQQLSLLDDEVRKRRQLAVATGRQRQAEEALHRSQLSFFQRISSAQRGKQGIVTGPGGGLLSDTQGKFLREGFEAPGASPTTGRFLPRVRESSRALDDLGRSTKTVRQEMQELEDAGQLTFGSMTDSVNEYADTIRDRLAPTRVRLFQLPGDEGSGKFPRRTALDSPFDVGRNKALQSQIDLFRELRDAANDADNPDLAKSFDAQADALERYAEQARNGHFSLERLNRDAQLADATLRRGLIPTVGELNTKEEEFNKRLEETHTRLGRFGDNAFTKSLREGSKDLDEINSKFGKGFFAFLRRRTRTQDGGFRFGVTADEVTGQLDRMSKAAGATQNALNRLSTIDETVGIAFRRIARLLAIIIILIPFVTVAIGLLSGAVTSLIAGVTALAGAFSTLIGFLGTLPTLAAAAIGAFAAFKGVFGPAISNISTAVKQALSIEDLAQKNRVKNDEAVRNAEERLADVRRRNAQQIEDIEENAADRRRSLVESIADAEAALHQAKRANAEEEKDQRANIIDQQIENARRLKDAEDDLANIRRKNNVREKSLLEDVNNARAGLAALRVQGASELAIAAQEGRVNQAQLTLDTFKADSPAANAEKNAEKRVREVKRDGAKEIDQLRERLRRTIRDNAIEESKAQTRIQRIRRDGYEDLADLEEQRHQQVIDNLSSERDATQAVTEAKRQANGDTSVVLAGLNPQERKVAETILRIREAWLKLTEATRSRGLTSIQEFLNFLEKKLPAIADLVNRFAKVLISLFDQAFAKFSTGEGAANISKIFEAGIPVLSKFGEALIEVADAFLKIGVAALPLVKLITDGFLGEATKFNEAVTKGQSSGGLDSFLADSATNAQLLADALKPLARALLNILEIAQPFGQDLLRSFREWAIGVEEFTTSLDGKKSISSYFSDSIPIFRSLVTLGKEVVRTFFNIGRELSKPTEGGGVSFLQTIIEGLISVLPRFQQFVIDSTTKNGPALINFLAQLVVVIGHLVGPGGVFVILLDYIGVFIGLINKIGNLPGGEFLLKFFFAMVTVGPLLKLFATRVIFGLNALKLFLVTMTEVTFGLKGLSVGLSTLLGGPLLLLGFLLGPTSTGGQLAILGSILLPRVVKNFGPLIAGVGGAAESFKRLRVMLAAGAPFLTALNKTFPRLAKAAVVLGKAMTFLSLKWTAALALMGRSITIFGVTVTAATTVGIIGAIVLIITTIILLERKWKVFSRLGKYLFEQFRRILDWFKRNWKEAIVALILGPFYILNRLIGDRARKLGADIVKGIIAGIKSLGSQLKDALLGPIKSALGFAGRFLGISSPSRFTWRKLGTPMMDGMIAGIKERTPDFVAAFAQAVKNGIAAADKEIKVGGRKLESSLGGLRSTLDKSFDSRLEARTPEEKRLEAFERQQARNARQEQINEVTSAVSAAQARVTRLESKAGGIKTSRFVGHPSSGRVETTTSRTAEQNREIAEAKRELRDAQKARSETMKQIATEDQRERLNREAAESRVRLEKTIEQERNAANKALDAFERTLLADLKSGDKGRIGKARKRLVDFFAQQGVYELAGGNIINLGIIPGLEKAEKNLLTTVDKIANNAVTRLALIKSRSVAEFEKLFPRVEFKNGKFTFVFDDPLKPKQNRKYGGPIYGSEGAATPVLAHAGEWVLNRDQQRRNAAMLGISTGQLAQTLFTRNISNRGLSFATGGVVPTGTGAGGFGNTVHIPVTINTSSAQVDALYLSRVLEDRMRRMA